MLTREVPDFSPLDFGQRFTGTFSADGDTITGAWENASTAANGSTTSPSSTTGTADATAWPPLNHTEVSFMALSQPLAPHR